MRNYGLDNRDRYSRRYAEHQQKAWLYRLKMTFCLVLTFALVIIVMILLAALAGASDDGRYAASPLKPWFDKLASKKGLCCSFADGFKIDDVDWDTKDGHFRARINGSWVVVPDSAVITEPNRFGPAVVWPYQDSDGYTQIRCFMPGAGT